MAWFGSEKDDMKVKDTSEPHDPVYPWQKCGRNHSSMEPICRNLSFDCRRQKRFEYDGAWEHVASMSHGLWKLTLNLPKDKGQHEKLKSFLERLGEDLGTPNVL